MKSDKSTNPEVKFHEATHIACPVFPPMSVEGVESLTREVKERLASDAAWASALWDRVRDELLLQAGGKEILAERAIAAAEEQASTAERQRKATVEAAQRRWRTTDTSTPLASLAFWLNFQNANGTFRVGRRDEREDAFVTPQHAPRAAADNIRQVAEFLRVHAEEGNHLWVLPESIDAVALAVEDGCALWERLAERFAFPVTLAWRFGTDAATTYYLFRGQAPVKGDFVIVPGLSIVRKTVVPLPCRDKDEVCRWVTDPVMFGAALTGEQADLPSLPVAFTDALRNVAATELRFRATYFGMLLQK
jgi:hypothetical protein